MLVYNIDKDALKLHIIRNLADDLLHYNNEHC